VSILDGTDIVYVARAAQRKVMSIALMPGSRLPAYCTSMGRVLLAALPENDARLRLGSAPLPARTQHTLTSPDAIMAEIARVRAKGFAIIDQEVEVNLQSLAVPLFNVWGKTDAALNVGVAGNGPTGALEDRYLHLIRAVQSELRQQLM
jgi:IclR family transcriptional regulator, pca regulon regulatory protein